MTTGGAPRGGEETIGRAHGLKTAVVSVALRFALRAPQGFAPGNANDKDRKKNQKKKGTLLNDVRKGDISKEL